MNLTVTQRDIQNVIMELVKEIGLVENVNPDCPICIQGVDSLESVDIALKLEGRFAIENLVIFNTETPVEIAENVWRIYKKRK